MQCMCLDQPTNQTNLRNQLLDPHNQGTKPVIQLFNSNSGITVLPKGQLCLPTQEFLVIATFDFTSWIAKLTKALQEILKITKPIIEKSQVEPESLRQKRDTPQAVTPTVTSTTTKATTTVQTIDLPIVDALSAFQLTVRAADLTHILSNQISDQLFSMYQTASILPQPYGGPYFFTPREHSPKFYNENNFAYVTLGQSFSQQSLKIFHAFLFDLALNRTRIPIRNNEAQFLPSSDLDRLQFASSLADTIASIFNSIEQMIFSLRNNLLPPQLYNATQLDTVLEHLKIRFPNLIPLEELKDILYSVPTTSLTKTVCSSKMQCPINFVTRIPIITKHDQFKVFQVITLPTFHESFTANQWKTLNVPEETILYNDQSLTPINFETDLECDNILSKSPCQVCHKHSINRKPFSECFQAILNNKDPWTDCPSTTLSEVYDQVYKLNDQQFAFTDINPGVVTENCSGKDKQIISMPYTGMLTMSPTCEYKILNGPFKPSDIEDSKVTIISGDESHEVIIQELPENKIQEHFNNYGFEYAIILGTIILVIPPSIWIIVYYRRRQQRLRRSRRRARIAERERLRTNLTTQIQPTVYRSTLLQLLNNPSILPPPPNRSSFFN